MGPFRPYLVCFSFCLIFAVATLVYISFNHRLFNGQSPQSNNKMITQTFTVFMPPQRQKRFPRAIIIGAKKCGTTSLKKILKYHPSIQAADNEVVYFSKDSHYKLGMNWYLEHMPLSTSDQLTIEKSPQYFISTLAPKRLRSVSEDVKILLILRNPLVRAVSDYYFQKQHGRGKDKSGKGYLSFTQKVFWGKELNTKTDEVKVSMYDVHYKNWLKWFPREQILIVDGDNLKINPYEELSVVEAFLNIPHYFEKSMFHHDNTSRRYYFKREDSLNHHSFGKQNNYDFSQLSEATLKKVAMFLQPHVDEFCRIALVNFTWCIDIYSDSSVEFLKNL